MNEIMDIISTPIIVTLMGVLMSFITQLAKKWGISPKTLLIGMSIGIALGMTAFQTFLPENMKKQIMLFAQSSLGMAVVIYEFFIKAKIEKK